jgi:hypothetical protein
MHSKVSFLNPNVTNGVGYEIYDDVIKVTEEGNFIILTLEGGHKVIFSAFNVICVTKEFI